MAEKRRPDPQPDDEAKIRQTRDLLLHALPHPSPALCWRRLRYEIAHKWTPAMLRGFRALRHQADGGLEVDFAVAGQRLLVEFSPHYPFHALRLRVMSRRVPRGPDVARALHARLPPPELRLRVARYLAEPRAVPLKEWVYRRHSLRFSQVAGADAMRRCAQTLPPHFWSPAMDLAVLWGTARAFLDDACGGGTPEAFF